MTITTIAPMLSERSLRRARLVSGLIMLTFLTLHLTNHALNLISLAAAEEGRRWFLAIWRNPVGTTLFYGAAVTHVMLAMRSLYLRRTFYMPVGEALQIILGLVIPLLIIDHVVGTRIRHEISNYYDSYEAIIRGFWITSPFNRRLSTTRADCSERDSLRSTIWPVWSKIRKPKRPASPRRPRRS